MSTSSATRSIHAAASQVHAAHAIVADPGCDHTLAATHLMRAWIHIASAVGVDPPLDDGGTDLGAWLDARTLERVPAPRRTVVHAQIQAIVRMAADDHAEMASRSEALSARAMMQHMRTLRSVLSELGAPTRDERVRLALAWGRRAFTWGAVAAAVVLLAWRPWQSSDHGPWRGAYYPSEDFRGTPTMRRDADIDFDWGREAPLDDIPSDRFGVRWDSCLTITERTEATFQLISDDGSRLFIDGKLVVDNWGKHAPTSKGKTVTLDPGTYHLLIEYFDAKYDASIRFLGSFDEEHRPGPIPADMLDFPRGELDGPAPCGARPASTK